MDVTAKELQDALTECQQKINDSIMSDFYGKVIDASLIYKINCKITEILKEHIPYITNDSYHLICDASGYNVRFELATWTQ